MHSLYRMRRALESEEFFRSKPIACMYFLRNDAVKRVTWNIHFSFIMSVLYHGVVASAVAGGRLAGLGGSASGIRNQGLCAANGGVLPCSEMEGGA